MTDRTGAPTASTRRRRRWSEVWIAAAVGVAQLVAPTGDIAAEVVDLFRADGVGVCCCGADCRCGPGGCGGAHRQATSQGARHDGQPVIVEPTVVTTGRRCADALAPQLTQTRPIPFVLDQVGGRSVPSTRSRTVDLDGAGRYAHAERSAPSPRGPPIPSL